ncbi:MAG: M1 family peptidase, partial [Pseudomonadota bacterium]
MASIRFSLVCLLLGAAVLAGCDTGTASDAAEPSPGPVPESAVAKTSDNPADAVTRAAPLGRLPDTATPTHYALSLTVPPAEPRFTGEVAIRVTLHERAEGLYLHGRDLNVTHAAVSTPDGAMVRASYQQLTDDGVAYVAFSRPIDAGDITLAFAWDAPFNERLLGLYRVEEDGRAYAFTQFESIFARQAFVSFDEPRFKTPYDATLTVAEDHVAIFNTEAVETLDAPDGMKRLRFATTEKLPTYLVALAVGALDVVEAPDIPPSRYRKRPLPLRGVAAHGKGADLA